MITNSTDRTRDRAICDSVGTQTVHAADELTKEIQ